MERDVTFFILGSLIAILFFSLTQMETGKKIIGIVVSIIIIWIGVSFLPNNNSANYSNVSNIENNKESIINENQNQPSGNSSVIEKPNTTSESGIGTQESKPIQPPTTTNSVPTPTPPTPKTPDSTSASNTEPYEDPNPNQFGSLTVEVYPKDAQIYINGTLEKVGIFSNVKYPVGEVTIIVKKRGYKTITKIVTVSPNQLTPVKIDLIPEE